MTTETFNEFVKAVIEMRSAQQLYFRYGKQKNNATEYLERAKNREQRVDSLLEELRQLSLPFS